LNFFNRGKASNTCKGVTKKVGEKQEKSNLTQCDVGVKILGFLKGGRNDCQYITL